MRSQEGLGPAPAPTVSPRQTKRSTFSASAAAMHAVSASRLACTSVRMAVRIGAALSTPRRVELQAGWTRFSLRFFGGGCFIASSYASTGAFPVRSGQGQRLWQLQHALVGALLGPPPPRFPPGGLFLRDPAARSAPM